MHTDFYWHSKLKLYRRINLHVYLNRDWREEYGGHLQLWNEDHEKRAAYLPSWTRTIISIIAPKAYHGLPEPISCPESVTRKSLAAWYNTSDLPVESRREYKLHKPDWSTRKAEMVEN